MRGRTGNPPNRTASRHTGIVLRGDDLREILELTLESPS